MYTYMALPTRQPMRVSRSDIFCFLLSFSSMASMGNELSNLQNEQTTVFIAAVTHTKICYEWQSNDKLGQQFACYSLNGVSRKIEKKRSYYRERKLFHYPNGPYLRRKKGPEPWTKKFQHDENLIVSGLHFFFERWGQGKQPFRLHSGDGIYSCLVTALGSFLDCSNWQLHN